MSQPQWKIDTIREMLSENVLHVKFEKLDGTIKEVVATMNPKYFPGAHSNFDPLDKGNTSTISYWDMDKGGFRSISLTTDFMVIQNHKSLPKKYQA